MNLTEWKKQTAEKLRETAKAEIRQGVDLVESGFLTEEVISELFEEVKIEDFSEIVSFEEEFVFETFTDPETGIVEEFDFEPSKLSERMDLEFEIDLVEGKVPYVALGKIRDMLFAEDYDVVVEAEKAKVVFNRAGGHITKKKKCAPGMKLKGNKCVPQTGTEKAGNRVQGIKLKRAKKAMGAGKKKKAAIKAKITKKRVAAKARNFSGTTN